MAEPTPPTPPPPPPAEPAAAPSASGPAKAGIPKPRERNPVFKMMGLPALPRRLPSRNWLIFWALASSLSAAIVYDKREKNRATAKWRRAVAPLALEPLPSASQLPRKLTIYLEAPPGDGLRAAQDHFLEYVKPVLAASGLDWDFVQGRQQGDVRAAVAERIRRARCARERPADELPKTDDSVLEDVRARLGLPRHQGANGDVVIGRHTWKEYIRGLHEGWLGSLDPPPAPETPEPKPKPQTEAGTTTEAKAEVEGEDKDKDREKKEEEQEDKPSRPPQPPPYNSPDDYAAAAVPAHIPAEFAPSAPIAFPHRLGVRHTFVRLGRFFNRRKLADDIGRDVAAVCFAAARDWREPEPGHFEQQLALQHEEHDWPKSVWKANEAPADDSNDDNAGANAPAPPKERIWASQLVVDPRIVSRMRRFEILPEDEARAAAIRVPEEEIEGWLKGSLRGLGRWGMSLFDGKPKGPNVGNLDDD
ncbi:Mitochondrial import inner membrane translocase subunit tim54 [Escovopsis weberi]|uniref:Mitochondrial import inner membrane translocase subunit TIM54 n=1 Tax=Escovopsis weberi TaxID=150374 RepID=A0A0M8N541_ESCWE|nr:Mitochondrial import inner membrane translocase subunit tim54 [Escovopsis weberi]